MDRIVIEVDEATAKKWQLAPAKFKKEISESIAKVLDDSKKENFLTFLDELSEKMAQRGLTEQTLNDILKDD